MKILQSSHLKLYRHTKYSCFIVNRKENYLKAPVIHHVGEKYILCMYAYLSECKHRLKHIQRYINILKETHQNILTGFISWCQAFIFLFLFSNFYLLYYVWLISTKKSAELSFSLFIILPQFKLVILQSWRGRRILPTEWNIFRRSFWSSVLEFLVALTFALIRWDRMYFLSSFSVCC